MCWRLIRLERRRSPAVKALGIASAAVLGAADVVLVGKGRIPRVYLGDAAAELAVIGGWIID